MSSPVRYIAAPLCVAIWLTGMLAGCNAQEGSDKGKKSPSQVAVKVNKEEISVHQINDMLSRMGNIPEDQQARARAAVVERLVEQELMLQQAKSKQLDRNPNVSQVIEFSRREILARAYGEQIAGNVARPGEAEIAKFYDEHPELFAKRRIYSLQEITIQMAPERFDEARAQLESGANPQQLMAWLNEQKIPFGVSASVKPAEQIPLEMLKNLSQLNPGQAAFVRMPPGAHFIMIAGAQEEPVDRAKAKPFIEAFLLKQARDESVRVEIKRLRETSSIDYIGDFAPSATESPAPMKQEAPAVSNDASSPEDSMRSALEKGATKLK